MSVLLIEHHRGHAIACNTEKRGPQFYWVLGATHMGYFDTSAAARRSIDSHFPPPEEPIPMNPNEIAVLRSAGLALYGNNWQSPLARALGVSDRTMRRWIAGNNDMPKTFWLKIEQLLDSRLATIPAVCAAIRGGQKS